MTDIVSGPAYRIQTERLLIRCWNPSDAPLLAAAIQQSFDHLSPWMPWARREPLQMSERVELLRRFRGQFDLNQDYVYGIFNPDETRVLGGTGLHTRVGEGAREIGYWIHVDFINRGLATESTAALTKVAFEVDDVRWVEIHCDPENIRSAIIPEKLGFTHEATLRQRLVDGPGEPRDTMIWTLFADDYPSSYAAGVAVEAFNAIGGNIL
jgi:RimJ/RimL family protein N-acetyltransferase